MGSRENRSRGLCMGTRLLSNSQERKAGSHGPKSALPTGPHCRVGSLGIRPGLRAFLGGGGAQIWLETPRSWSSPGSGVHVGLFSVCSSQQCGQVWGGAPHSDAAQTGQGAKLGLKFNQPRECRGRSSLHLNGRLRLTVGMSPPRGASVFPSENGDSEASPLGKHIATC